MSTKPLKSLGGWLMLALVGCGPEAPETTAGAEPQTEPTSTTPAASAGCDPVGATPEVSRPVHRKPSEAGPAIQKPGHVRCAPVDGKQTEVSRPSH